VYRCVTAQLQHCLYVINYSSWFTVPRASLWHMLP
jgi:hypothetical protein